MVADSGTKCLLKVVRGRGGECVGAEGEARRQSPDEDADGTGWYSHDSRLRVVEIIHSV